MCVRDRIIHPGENKARVKNRDRTKMTRWNKIEGYSDFQLRKGPLRGVLRRDDIAPIVILISRFSYMNIKRQSNRFNVHFLYVFSNSRNSRKSAINAQFQHCSHEIFTDWSSYYHFQINRSLKSTTASKFMKLNVLPNFFNRMSSIFFIFWFLLQNSIVHRILELPMQEADG